MEKRVIGVNERLPFLKCLPLSIQHVFAMFGATVLVPTLFNIDPGIVLFMNGLGTLLFLIITKGKSPAYLGSSFAFLAIGQSVIATYGYQTACGAFIVTGLVGCLIALCIKFFGTKWIDVVLPPAAMGPIVALIGLELASSAASTAGIISVDGAPILTQNVVVFIITLVVAVLGGVVFKGFFKLIPILIAIIAGFVTAVGFGMIDFSALRSAPLIQVPNVQAPVFNINAILMMLPVVLVTTTEHIGHQVVTSKIIGKDLLKDPGLDRSLFADNFSTAISGAIGSVPTTTYGENIGVMAMTKVYSVQVIAIAAVISILMGFLGQVSAFIQLIPQPVIGGISFILYGMIGASGIRILIDNKVNYDDSVNLTLTSVVFITGLSGVSVSLGNITLSGMVLACVVGMILGIIFYVLKKLKLTNDE